MRILILGGTTEASVLADRLAGDTRFEPTLSLAGRTQKPRLPPIAYRIGGFGGVEGLTDWLGKHNVAVIIDATHPYAARISANAVAAAAITGIPVGSIFRAPWLTVEDDRWHHVADPSGAAAAIGGAPRGVFLSLGRLELQAFRTAPQHHYLARTIDPVEKIMLPPLIEVIHARGPFDVEDEMRLLREHAIDVIVSKNSGGAATYAKIEAARRLNRPVIMIARPNKPQGRVLSDPAAALDWLATLHRDHSGSRSPRGV